MTIDITVPGVGESIKEGLLAAWAVSDGSAVIEGQALFELETDKTTIDVTSPATGTLKIIIPEGTNVTINQVVGQVETGVSGAAERIRSQDAPIQSAAGTGIADTGIADSGAAAEVKKNTRITPAAKAAAGASGADPSVLKGTGRGGLVTREDVLNSAEKGGPAADSAARTPAAVVLPSASAAALPSAAAAVGGEVRKPLSRIRSIIAANLSKTRNELVLLTTFNEADMSAIKSIRARYGEEFLEKHQVKLGFMGFFLKASAAALKKYPEINAYIDGNEVVYRDGVHISVAVSTPKGLVTPVVRHVESLSFAEIEKEIAGFSRKAVEKTLLPDELMGGTFTVTNGGIFGSMMSTPLPAPGQSAVLGMHAVIDRPVAVDGQVVIRPMMYLALSYDHRLVDGREAVGCLKSIRDTLENPERLMLEV